MKIIDCIKIMGDVIYMQVWQYHPQLAQYCRLANVSSTHHIEFVFRKRSVDQRVLSKLLNSTKKKI